MFLSTFYREAKRAISNFLCLGCRTVIITLGGDGAIFASNEDPKPIHVRAPKVEEVLDTTVSLFQYFDSTKSTYHNFCFLYSIRVLEMLLLVH